MCDTAPNKHLEATVIFTKFITNIRTAECSL